MVTDSTISDLRTGKMSVLGPVYGDRRNEGAVIPLDKSWHIIHYMLTGEIDIPQNRNAFYGVVLSDNYVNKGNATVR